MKKIFLFFKIGNYLFNYTFNIFEILIKSKKIINFINKKNNENVCICYEGGFGVICNLCDRLIKSKKFFFNITF